MLVYHQLDQVIQQQLYQQQPVVDVDPSVVIQVVQVQLVELQQHQLLVHRFLVDIVTQ